MTATPDQLLDDLYDNILVGAADVAAELTRRGLSMRVAPTDMLFEAMIPALEEVGSRFEGGVCFLPEMLIAARSMQAAMDVLRPHIVKAGVQPIGTFVMGTVAGDIHDVGKNLCNVMLEGSGFDVVDLGINVPAEKFAEAITEHEPVAVGMSAFLTTTMFEIETNIQLIENEGLRDRAVILAGGAPVNEEFAESVGADGYAKDANSIVRVTRALVGIEGPHPRSQRE